jgi:hypothetical protein
VRWLLLVFVLPGCDAWNGNRRPDPPLRSHLEITLQSRCARPVELCYAADRCVTVADGKPQKVRAEASGNQVPVELRGSDRAISADETFDLVEVDESCERVARRVGPRKESTAATAGGPAR